MIFLKVLMELQCESKNPPWGYMIFFIFFQKPLRIFNQFFAHLLYVPMYALITNFYSIISNFDEVMPY